jgi:hypothetical protein
MPSRKLIYTSFIACVSRRTSCASPSETYLTIEPTPGSPECASFPKGAHDDQVDCCTQALKALQVGWGQIQTLYCELDEDDRVHISPY